MYNCCKVTQWLQNSRKLKGSGTAWCFYNNSTVWQREQTRESRKEEEKYGHFQRGIQECPWCFRTSLPLIIPFSLVIYLIDNNFSSKEEINHQSAALLPWLHEDSLGNEAKRDKFQNLSAEMQKCRLSIGGFKWENYFSSLHWLLLLFRIL